MSYFGRNRLVKFDPDEARDHGKWTSGGAQSATEAAVASKLKNPDGKPSDKGPTDGPAAGTPSNEGQGKGPSLSFVSPNNDPANMDFNGAHAALTSQRQKQLLQASSYIDGALGISSHDSSVIGAWSDGAENSVMTTVKGADFDTLKLGAAMKGYLADQKAVLVFQQEKGGGATLANFHATGDVNSIHKNALADGLAFHTLVPDADGKGATVYVADLDNSARDAISKGAKRYGGTVSFSEGRAEFVGTTKEDGDDRAQRDDARAQYQAVIGSSPVGGASVLWNRVHDRYGEGLTVKQGGVHQAAGPPDDMRSSAPAIPEKADVPDAVKAKNAKTKPPYKFNKQGAYMQPPSGATAGTLGGGGHSFMFQSKAHADNFVHSMGDHGSNKNAYQTVPFANGAHGVEHSADGGKTFHPL